MKVSSRLIFPVLFAVLLAGMPGTVRARVMMTGAINPSTGFNLGVLAAASLTVDDWFSTSGLWWVTVTNAAGGDSVVVDRARIRLNISSDQFPNIIENGVLDLAGGTRSYHPGKLKPGESVVVDNKDLSGTNAAMSGKWNDDFVDEVLRIGYLPEGTYTLKFTLEYRYTGEFTYRTDVDPLDATFEIRNPGPPELVVPDDGADNVVAVPRFSWQEPVFSVYTLPRGVVRPKGVYTVTVWKMFDDTGNTLTKEQAVRRVPVWKQAGITNPFVDFDPGSAREELVSGLRYCWQVQGFDATGRHISSRNEGKSDIREFTVRFTPPVLTEPILFFPLRFSWTPAQAGGNTVLYDIQIADNPDFVRPVAILGQIPASYTYPEGEKPLKAGKTYYLRLRTTNARGIALGTPVVESFTVPAVEVAPSAPEDGAVVSTMTPLFRWQGAAKTYTVTVFREDTRWKYVSGTVEGTSWTYDGDSLERGVTYSWQVTPVDSRGEAAGDVSETRRFITPSAAQVTLVSPVGQTLGTVFPVFSWNPIPGAGEDVSYAIRIMTADGAEVYAETVSGLTFEYPRTAPPLQYGTRYLWGVKALKDGSDYGQPSARAWFVTPFAASTGEVSYAEVDAAIKQVLADYPGFAAFKDKTVTGITDGGVPLSPAQLMGLFSKYRIKSTSVK